MSKNTPETGLPGSMTLASRQTAAIRIVAAIAVPLTVYYVFDSVSLGDHFTVWLYTASTFVFVGAILAARKFRMIAGFMVINSVCVICVASTINFGREVGSQTFLLALGPLAALLLGMNRPYAVVFYCTVSTALITFAELSLPRWTKQNEPLLPQLTLPTDPGFGFNGMVINYTINTLALEFGLGLCTYFAMHWASLAEAALGREHARSELLLRNLLPASIASQLKDDPSTIIAENFESISILFADVVNFTPTSARKAPEDVINFLRRLFNEFDTLAERHGLEKIKTIGDCYMVAGGMPQRHEGHAQSMADMALDMITAAQRLTGEFDDELSIRIGLHVGPAMAGVIGQSKPYYDVWGDTINVASRMESSGLPGRIQITPEVKDILGPRYDFERRGVIDIKGKGPMELYFLVGRSAENKSLSL